VTITSECRAIQRLRAELTEVVSPQEISYRNGGPLTHGLATCHLQRAACPVSV
jgi:hypothetical protein